MKINIVVQYDSPYGDRGTILQTITAKPTETEQDLNHRASKIMDRKYPGNFCALAMVR